MKIHWHGVSVLDLKKHMNNIFIQVFCSDCGVMDPYNFWVNQCLMSKH